MNSKSMEWPSWQPEKPEPTNEEVKPGTNNQKGKRPRGRPRKGSTANMESAYFEGIPLNYEWVLERRSLSFERKMQEEQEGISKIQLVQLKDLFGLDYDRLAEMLAVTNRALHLRKGNDKLNRNMTERLLAIAEVYCAGYHTFGSPPMFDEWLNAPNRYLGERSPISILSSLTGLYEVRELIYRLDHFML